jgi:hypothetical protein
MYHHNTANRSRHGSSCRGCADELGVYGFDVAAVERPQLFSVADQESQIAEAIDATGDAMRELENGFDGR